MTAEEVSEVKSGKKAVLANKSLSLTSIVRPEGL